MAQRSGEVFEAGYARKHAERHFDRPLPRGQQFDVAVVVESLPAAGDPLREVDQVRGDIGNAFTLHGYIENPGWPHQRHAVDDLEKVMDALHRNGGLAAISTQAAEYLGLCGERHLQSRRDVVAFRHDVHRQWRRCRGILQHPDLARVDQPWFVAEHEDTVRVQAVDRCHLAVVLSGDDHDVAGPFGAQAFNRVLPTVHVQVPARRVVGALVESPYDAQEIFQVRPVPGIDVDVVAEPRVALAQGERSVKMPRIENQKSVLVGGQILSLFSASSGAGMRWRHGRHPAGCRRNANPARRRRKETRGEIRMAVIGLKYQVSVAVSHA